MNTLELDKDIITKASSGDLRAFETIFNVYEKYVLNLAYRIVYNKDDAHDIKQEVFLRIYKSLNTYNENFKFKTWIYRIAINTALTHKSNIKKHSSLIENFKNILLLKNNKPEETVENKDLIIRMLTKLPKNYRVLLVLREAEELSYDEIAETLSCSVQSVKVKLFRARKALLKEKESLLMEV